MSKKDGRVIYESPSLDPQESLHWMSLHDCSKKYNVTNNNNNNDNNHSININNHEELLQLFQRDVNFLNSNNNKDNYQILALWSCIIGYCEALSTYKEATRRYSLYPIPYDSLHRLVRGEFLPLLNHAQDSLNKAKLINATEGEGESIHRKTARAVANAIWNCAQNRNSNMKDELHANNLYTCLCGGVDGKSLDCFGSTLLVVLGMNILGFSSSCLTLSEDHGYESHIDNEEGRFNYATCEVAIPGNTKAAQEKRGKDISSTFEELKRNNSITAETSWLYMRGNAVVCDTPGMAFCAMVGNISCDIDKQKVSAIADGSKKQIVSGPLYKMKRDMLWILEGEGYMRKFPFALMELGEAEEHISSAKGSELVNVKLNGKATTEVLRNEKLFLDAMHISKAEYGDAQVYPYLYAAHYHRDAGRDDEDEEYRLVESLRLYSEATRVASGYRYDAKDCMQLMKHFTIVAALIMKDILLQSDDENRKERRTWLQHDNAVAAASWLIGYFDSLLLWEEKEHRSFVEILSLQHKHSISKLFQLFTAKVRVEAIAKIHSKTEEEESNVLAITEEKLLYFRSQRARRLVVGSPLILALSKETVKISELAMSIPTNNTEGRSTRQRKRVRA